jgi:hypothetical protein
MDSGGSIKVSDSGEDTLARPGSWNGAKAQEGSPEDLRGPIRVHVRETGATGSRYQGPGLQDTSDLAGALRRTRRRR